MRRPDAEGVIGSAWDCTVEAIAAQNPAVIATWIIHSPASHPWWHVYQLGVITLADMPGFPPAHKQYPDAEYELLIVALDPGASPDPEVPDTWRPLLPANVVVQFDGCTEPWAVDVAKMAVQAIVHGQLPLEPDDFIGSREAWTSAVRATAQHQQYPHH